MSAALGASIVFAQCCVAAFTARVASSFSAVKVLGAFELIDQGEQDYKIIVLSIEEYC